MEPLPCERDASFLSDHPVTMIATVPGRDMRLPYLLHALKVLPSLAIRSTDTKDLEHLFEFARTWRRLRLKATEVGKPDYTYFSSS